MSALLDRQQRLGVVVLVGAMLAGGMVCLGGYVGWQRWQARSAEAIQRDNLIKTAVIILNYNLEQHTLVLPPVLKQQAEEAARQQGLGGGASQQPSPAPTQAVPSSTAPLPTPSAPTNSLSQRPAPGGPPRR